MQLGNQEILFSVVIPLYNKEGYILDTLNSVFNQNYQNFEIIVINDGSTDNSLKTLKTISDKRLHCFTIKNSGVSVARNSGIEKAVGSHIALLDADDCWQSNHLSEFIEAINKFPKESIYCNNYKIQFTNRITKDTQFSYLPSSNNIVIIDDFFKSSLLNSIATSSTTCIKKEVLIENTYDVTIKSGQDTDLWTKLGVNNSYVFNNTVTVIIDKGVTDSLSKSKNGKYRFIFTQKYRNEEKNNFYLKKFMDKNRFSVIVRFLHESGNNKQKIAILKNQIDERNLSLKERVFLKLPTFLWIYIIKLKNFVE